MSPAALGDEVQPFPFKAKTKNNKQIFPFKAVVYCRRVLGEELRPGRVLLHKGAVHFDTCYPMLCNIASGPEIVFLGRISAEFKPQKN